MRSALLYLVASGLGLSSPAAGGTSPVATVAPVPQNTGSAVPMAQAQAALDFNNAKRAEVGTPPLQWSTQQAAAAQNWANHLAQTNKCNLQHMDNDPYGQNLFGGWGKPYTVVDAMTSWYSEKPKYTGFVLNGSNWAAAGHYTQMVWRTTTLVGMGQASCGTNGPMVIVAEYSPQGNMMGQKAY